MPTSYHCDFCDVSSDSLDGWLLVAVAFLHMDPSVPTPPGGRTLDSTAPDLLFHAVACRDGWCARAELRSPTSTS